MYDSTQYRKSANKISNFIRIVKKSKIIFIRMVPKEKPLIMVSISVSAYYYKQFDTNFVGKYFWLGDLQSQKNCIILSRL